MPLRRSRGVKRDKVFVSYSHADKEVLGQLQTLLKPVLTPEFRQWDDTQIPAGSDWKEQIDNALATAKVAVLLVSPEFLASDFIKQHELRPLLQAAQKNRLVILWIYVRECLYGRTPIAKLQAAHNIAKPLDNLPVPKRKRVLAEVSEKVVEEFHKRVAPSRLPVAGSEASEALGPAKETQPETSGTQRRRPGMGRKERPKAPLSMAADHLPPLLTPVIGRASDIGKVTEILSGGRLLTLMGSPGIGKTYLAIEAGRSLRSAYDDVRFVKLEQIRKGEDQLILPTIAAAVETRLPAEGSLAALVEFLREKRLLLILDKCEHVVKTVKEIISALATGCPNVSILATSRERLRIKGNTHYEVPPLALPDPGLDASLKADTAIQYGAIALFIELAKRSDPSFAITNQKAPLIARICRRLDGIPQAIELCAARVSTLAPAELLTRLEKHFDLLSGSSRDGSPTEATMQSALDWSYDLLDEREQGLLRALAVFASGFTREAVIAISTGEESVTGDLLDSLYDKSLVIAQARAESTEENFKRFRLLEFTREYALHKLGQAGESEQVARRHLEYFRQLVQTTEKTVEATASQAAFAALAPEWENFRAALSRALNSKDVADVAAGAALTASFEWLSFWFGSSTEGIMRVNAFLERIDSSQAKLVAQLWTVRAYLEGEMGLHGKSLESAKQAVSFARSAGDRVTLIRALAEYGVAGARQRDFEIAGAALDEAENLAGKSRTAVQRILLLGARANFLRLSGQLNAALETYKDRIKIQRGLRDNYGEAMSVLTLAEVEHARGETGQAVRLVKDVLQRVETRLGNDLRANLLANLAGYLLALDDRSGAREAAKQAIELCKTTDPSSNCITWALYHLALVFALEGQWERAARISGYAEATFAKVGYQLQYTEQVTQNRLRSLLLTHYSEKELESLLEEHSWFRPDLAIEEVFSV
jgi:predicted ATPase